MRIMRVTLNIWSLLCPPAPSLLDRKELKTWPDRGKKMLKVCATSQRTFAVNFTVVFNEAMPTVRAKGIGAVSSGAVGPLRVAESLG